MIPHGCAVGIIGEIVKDYLVCWREDLRDGFLEDFFAPGSNPIYTYNLIKGEDPYVVAGVFLDKDYDYAVTEDCAYLKYINEKIIEEFVRKICESDEVEDPIPQRFGKVAEQIWDRYTRECQKLNRDWHCIDDETDELCKKAVAKALDADALLDQLTETEKRNIYKYMHQCDVCVIELTSITEAKNDKEADEQQLVMDSLWK